MTETPLYWLGSSREDVRRFPAEARRIVGHQLHRVQNGLEPNNWKPMSSVGPGVHEIRVRTRGIYRLFYVAKFAEGVYVLHAFRKKTQRTRTADIELAKQRLKELHHYRHGQE